MRRQPGRERERVAGWRKTVGKAVYPKGSVLPWKELRPALVTVLCLPTLSLQDMS